MRCRCCGETMSLHHAQLVAEGDDGVRLEPVRELLLAQLRHSSSTASSAPCPLRGRHVRTVKALQQARTKGLHRPFRPMGGSRHSYKEVFLLPAPSSSASATVMTTLNATRSLLRSSVGLLYNAIHVCTMPHNITQQNIAVVQHTVTTCSAT